MRNAVLMLAIVAHYVLVGADAFGQFAIAPVALSAPPASLTMFQGEYVYNSPPFWQVTNTIALLLLIASLGMHWRTSRRNLHLGWLAGSIAISIVSLGYIFPEFSEIVSSPYSDTVDQGLVARGSQWRLLGMGRLLAFGSLGVLPLFALSRDP